jgi:diaminopimelate epimerase
VGRVCRRRWGIGADGIIVFRPSEVANYALEFYNPDGSTHGFCGNGSRCAVRVAALENWVGERQIVQLPGGEMVGQMVGEAVRLNLPPLAGLPEPREIEAEGRTLAGFSVDVWNPHLVVEVEPAELPVLEIERWGALLRSHPDLGEEGANVHFAALSPEEWGPHAIRYRAYERGVEGETWSCTSGAIACARAFLAAERVSPPVQCTPRSGATITVEFNADEPVVEGDARVVCRGVLSPEAADPPPEPIV